MFYHLRRLLVLAFGLCVLLSGSGCDTEDVLGSPYYDVSGHWTANTGTGRVFTMDLTNDDNNHSHATGQMTRDGFIGEFDGTITMDHARLNFTVKWPNGSQTTGEAGVYDDGHMRDGSLTDAGTTDTFYANRE